MFERFRPGRMLLLLAALGCTSAQAELPDPIFRSGFEPSVLPASDFQVAAWGTLDSSCPSSNPGTPEGRPGASVLLCYQLRNLGQTNLTSVRVIDPNFGLMAELSLELGPGETIVFPDAAGPRVLSGPLSGFPGFYVSDGARQGFRRSSHQVAFSPHLRLFRLLAARPADCAPGLFGPFPPPHTSGYRLRTVTPGSEVVHCLTMFNASTTGGTVGFPSLRLHTIVDSRLGVLAENASIELSAFPHRYWRLRQLADAPVESAEFSTQWSSTADWLHGPEPALINIEALGSVGLRVVDHPACDGIIEHTSSAYDALLGIPVASGIRLDFEVDAMPAMAGQAMQISATGFISNLQPAQAFGPRDDTRILLPLPEGIELESLMITGSISGGAPLQVTINTAQRLARLSTGPVPGVPATIFLSIEATPDGSRDSLVWPAPRLNMVVLGETGNEIINVLQPEAGAPPVLVQPLCTQ